MKNLIFAMTLLASNLGLAHGGHHHHPTPPQQPQQPGSPQPGLIHLSFFGGQTHAHITWAAGPQVGSESKLRLEWRRGSDHAFIEPAGSFDVSLWMPSMGHGSAPTQIRRATDENGQIVTGVYEISNLYFLMPGDWQVLITLKMDDGREDTQMIELLL